MSYFDEIRAQVNIVEIIQHYIQLKKKGNNWLGLCPFHNDSNPSLFVSEKLQLFNCFVCNNKGNVFHFVEKYKNVSFKQAVVEVCQIARVELDKKFLSLFNKQNSINEKFLPYFEACNIARFVYYDQLLMNINERDEQVLKFINQRQLTPEIIKRFRIGFAPRRRNFLISSLFQNLTSEDDEDRQLRQIFTELGYINTNEYDFFANRIIFPILDPQANVIGFSGRDLDVNSRVKYLNSPESIIFKKAELFFNYDEIQKINPQRIYICEGFMEIISLYRIGVTNAIALMGTNFSKFHIQLLANKKLNQLNEIVLCLDQDVPGQIATIEIARLLLQVDKWSISVLTNFPGSIKCKDLDEFIRQNDVSHVNSLLQQPINYFNWYSDYLLANSKIFDEISKKSKVASDVLKEIKQFATPNVAIPLVKQLAQKLDLEFETLKNEYNQLFARKTKQIPTLQIDDLSEMIMHQFNCEQTDSIVERAKVCFLDECKLITLFFSNLSIIEFDSLTHGSFVFKQLQVVYDTILNNALNGIIWGLNDFLRFVGTIDFSRNLISRYIQLFFINEQITIETLKSENNYEKKNKLLLELSKNTVIHRLKLERSKIIREFYQSDKGNKSKRDKMNEKFKLISEKLKQMYKK